MLWLGDRASPFSCFVVPPWGMTALSQILLKGP
jgi:hypothetical protein